jgi:predicted RecA/RadA family phage recombinase
MLSLIQPDVDNLTMVAPSGGVTKDVPVMIGDLCLIPVCDADEGELFSGRTRGVFRLKKHSGTAFTAGEEVEWDVSAGELIAPGSAAGDIKIGNVVIAAGSSDTYATIAKSNPTPVLNAGT